MKKMGLMGLKLSDKKLTNEILNILDDNMKGVFNELEQSLEGTGINIIELIVKWYNNHDLLKKYTDNSKGIEGVELLVIELSDFISEHNLDIELETIMEKTTDYITNRANGVIAQPGELTAADALGDY